MGKVDVIQKQEHEITTISGNGTHCFNLNENEVAVVCKVTSNNPFASFLLSNDKSPTNYSCIITKTDLDNLLLTLSNLPQQETLTEASAITINVVIPAGQKEKMIDEINQAFTNENNNLSSLSQISNLKYNAFMRRSLVLLNDKDIHQFSDFTVNSKGAISQYDPKQDLQRKTETKNTGGGRPPYHNSLVGIVASIASIR